MEGVESRVVPWSPDRLLLLIEAVAELPITRVEPGDLIAPDRKTLPPYFQLLLTTTVENAVPGKSSLVALRIIPI